MSPSLPGQEHVSQNSVDPTNRLMTGRIRPHERECYLAYPTIVSTFLGNFLQMLAPAKPKKHPLHLPASHVEPKRALFAPATRHASGSTPVHQWTEAQHRPSVGAHLQGRILVMRKTSGDGNKNGRSECVLEH